MKSPIQWIYSNSISLVKLIRSKKLIRKLSRLTVKNVDAWNRKEKTMQKHRRRRHNHDLTLSEMCMLNFCSISISFSNSTNKFQLREITTMIRWFKWHRFFVDVTEIFSKWVWKRENFWPKIESRAQMHRWCSVKSLPIYLYASDYYIDFEQ